LKSKLDKFAATIGMSKKETIGYSVALLLCLFVGVANYIMVRPSAILGHKATMEANARMRAEQAK
jgi:hypothetical protein